LAFPKASQIRSLAAFGVLSVLMASTHLQAAAQSSTVSDEIDTLTGAGVYFPPVSSTDTPEIRFEFMEEIGPQQRQAFVDQLNLATAGGERVLPIVIQAVGEDRSTLVIMNIETEAFFTPYIARALLARLTSLTRFLPAVSEMGLSPEFDIYNMASVLGFDRIVVTDGREFSHEARLVRPVMAQ